MTTEVKKLPFISPSYFQIIHNNKFKSILPSQLIYVQASFFKQTFSGYIEAWNWNNHFLIYSVIEIESLWQITHMER